MGRGDAGRRVGQAVLSLVLPLLAHAEQLPIRIYRNADGLGGDAVYSNVTAKNGYMWFGTNEGLSRFDGDQFTNYGANEGFSHTVVALLVTRDGGGTYTGNRGWRGQQRWWDSVQDDPKRHAHHAL